jgi:hypothetical protein
MFDSTRSAKVNAVSAVPSTRPVTGAALRHWAMSRAAAIASAALALSALAVGCAVASVPSESVGPSGNASAGSTGGSSSGGGPGNSLPDANLPPMVVDVDPGGTLTAAPGAGVGVFTQYRTGGHWSVWWTCDTNVTRQPCGYQIAVSATTGALSNLHGVALESPDELLQPTVDKGIALATTTTGRDEIDFDTDPGVSIELSVGLNPVPDTNFLFFVQGGQVNGGYRGNLTNPLILEPLSP